MSTQRFDVAIIGGCGHVGLPLGLTLAHEGKRVVLFDTNAASVQKIVDNQIMPFKEDGAQPVLEMVVANGNLTASTDPSVIGDSVTVITVVGTPVDEFTNPRVHDVVNAIREVRPYLRLDHLLILRSTLFPGGTSQIDREIKSWGMELDIAFCPERIAEGYAMTELYQLPQIVSGTTPQAIERASELFAVLAPKIIVLGTKEAELAKLFTNVWRYLQFAGVNSFWRIAKDAGCDFDAIRAAMMEDYPRLARLPYAGLAAGPCLYKDTMQLGAFASGFGFPMGDAAMRVNEGQPSDLVRYLEADHEKSIVGLKVGILGMAFKANNDDPRSSLSYKLRKQLMMAGAEVMCTDPYISDPRFFSVEEVIGTCDVIIIAAGHAVYDNLDFMGKPVIDPTGKFTHSAR